MTTNLKQFFLLIGDILILYISLYLTLVFRYFNNPSAGVWEAHFIPFTTTFIVWIIIFYISNLYSLHIAVNDNKFFNRTIQSVSIAGLLSALYFYINPNINIAPKTNLIIYLIIFTILFITWRRFFNSLIYSYLPKDNVAIIGYNNKVKELIKTLNSKPNLGYKIVATISGSSDSINEVQNIQDFSNLEKIIKDLNISTIILASDPHQSKELRAQLFSCLHLNINFFSLANFYEKITGKIPIDAINQMWFLENLNEGNKKVLDFLKRIIDLILAISVLLLTAIFWPIIGIIIKHESKGPIFFTQVRAGKNNKDFRLLKFRTMREEDNDGHLTEKNDSRVTKFGRFMRKTRIDEIPQVLNILLGDMSFVGPRPEQPKLIKQLEQDIPFYKERMLVKPGLTGWDQISGEYHSPTREDTLKKLQYDLYYIKNRSIYMDLAIMLKTIKTVLGSEGR